jgi:hypothetical protein
MRLIVGLTPGCPAVGGVKKGENNLSEGNGDINLSLISPGLAVIYVPIMYRFSFKLHHDINDKRVFDLFSSNLIDKGRGFGSNGLDENLFWKKDLILIVFLSVIPNWVLAKEIYISRFLSSLMFDEVVEFS